MTPISAWIIFAAVATMIIAMKVMADTVLQHDMVDYGYLMEINPMELQKKSNTRVSYIKSNIYKNAHQLVGQCEILSKRLEIVLIS